VAITLTARHVPHINSKTTGVVVHKDAAWSTQWENLKNNNPVVDG